MWLRYIDDIFKVWTHGEARVREFLDFINAFHDTIKFTWECSRDTVSFLDIQIFNIEGKAIEVVQRFCYLGDMIEAQGEAGGGVIARVRSG